MFNEETIAAILGNQTYKFAYLLILLILVFIVAWKEGLKAWVLDRMNSGKVSGENLTSNRGEPDFWVIDSAVADSRREHLKTPLTLLEKKRLVSLL